MECFEHVCLCVSKRRAKYTKEIKCIYLKTAFLLQWIGITKIPYPREAFFGVLFRSKSVESLPFPL